jgi:hypothetical protein
MLWQTKNRITHCFHRQYFSYVTIFLLSLPLIGNSQESLGTIALLATQVELDRLTSQQNFAQATFFVDEANTIQIEVIANVNDLAIQIKTPPGEILTPSTMEAFGGEFVLFGEPPTAKKNLPLLPFTIPGFHYLFRFPALGVGEYEVEFESQLALTQEVAVITQIITDSPAAANVIALPQQLSLGESTVITVAFFDGQQPLPNAEVKATLIDEGGQLQELWLFDDGSSDDAQAGDGLYSAQFTPSAIGTYRIVINIQGQNLQGTPCFRELGTQLSVLEPTSRLTGKTTVRKIDHNNNGLLEQLEVDVETNTVKTGEYRVFVHLETPQGQRLFRTAAATLTAGKTEDISVNFEIEALRELGKPGPYQIKLIDLIYYGDQGVINSDQLREVASIPAYQLEKPLFALTGQTFTQGIDLDGDDRFDQLHVSVAIDIVNKGLYFWTLKLTDLTGKRIAIAAGSKFFSTSGINHLVVDFDGSAIGNSGVDGPYRLTDLIINGPGIFKVVEAVGETPALLVRQFPFQAAPASCQLYAVHDEGLNQSQFFTVDWDNHQVKILGTPYPGYDIEGLAIHPQTNQIYASSGNRVAPYRAKGHLYLVDGQTGQLFAIGSTGFEEVDSLAFDDTGTLWGWAKGAGLITIDTNTGEGHLELSSRLKVEDLTISKNTDPPLFYGAVQTDLWQYPPLGILCAGKLPHETEALEMLSNNYLLFGTHQDQTFSIHLLELDSCSVITDADIVTPFNDIEGIALPQDACIDH